MTHTSRFPRSAATALVRAALFVALSLPSVAACAQSLYEPPPENVRTVWASPENPTGERGKAGTVRGGRKGSPTIRIPAGESRVLAEAKGTSGTIRRMWMTFADRSPKMLRSLKFDIYWDGAATPAVSAPVGDFFGVGLGRTAAFQSALFSNPEGRSFNCFVPMPFKTGMKVVMTNESDSDIPELFYDVDYTVGETHPPGTLYFHAYFNRQNPTKMQEDYELLPRVTGTGRYLGVNMGIAADTKDYLSSWWGEGEVKIYLDGDRDLPTIAGTGTEDYLGTAWGQGQFANQYAGCPVADERASRWCFYRYHVPDPIYFHQDVRVTIQQIGCACGDVKYTLAGAGKKIVDAGPGRVEKDLTKDGIFEREDDWSSCAYFYLDRPENGLPALMPVARRVESL